MVRVRFAPSPTGYLHIGGARTALFNWLYARRHGGTFVLRIEDTDTERSSWEMVAGIVDGLRWLGLDWDEGPDVGGPHAPYFQSQRDRTVIAHARNRLVPTGRAYYCYCSRGDAAAEAQAAEAAGGGVGVRPHLLRAAGRDIARTRAAGAPRAVRFKVPAGQTSFIDLVHGPIAFDNANIEDFVVLRSDRQPTYHLSVVADDIDMEITHVVRGDDHISNTPKQVLLYHAFDARAAAVRARAADPRARQEATEQASRRHVGDGVSAPWIPAGGDGQFSGAARLVAGRRSRAVHARRARRGVHARGDQRRQRGLQSRKARLVQPAAHPAPAARRAGAPSRAAAQDAGLWSDELDGPRREWLLRVLELVRPRVKRMRTVRRRTAAVPRESVDYDPARRCEASAAARGIAPAPRRSFEALTVHEPVESAGARGRGSPNG